MASDKFIRSRCIWMEFDLPDKVKNVIHEWRANHFDEFSNEKKPWKKHRLHATFIYLGEIHGYTEQELKKIISLFDYNPSVKITDFRRGDWSPVYFLHLEEVKTELGNINDKFKDAYKIATSNERSIEMMGHNEGKNHPGLHVTIFWSQEVDDKKIDSSKSNLWDVMKAKGIEEFSFKSIRVMGENPRTKEDYVIFEKKFK